MKTKDSLTEHYTADVGKGAMPLSKFYTTFSGIFSQYFITKCRRKLEKINFIKIYNYNPFDPAGSEKHIVLTGPGIRFYKSFIDALRPYILSPMEDPNYPSVRLPTISPLNNVFY
ncbi:hypothetical protein ES705_10427 [subsurface metagenome]